MAINRIMHRPIVSAAVAAGIVLLATGASAFTTSNTVVTRTFDAASAATDTLITATVRFTNQESTALRGFYLAENIPQSLTVATTSVRVNGTPVTNYLVEASAVGEVYANCRTYRWVLEIPPAFSQGNPVAQNIEVEIVYTVGSSQAGAFALQHFAWAGTYPADTEAFGHSDLADERVLTFTAIAPVSSVRTWQVYH